MKSNYNEVLFVSPGEGMSLNVGKVTVIDPPRVGPADRIATASIGELAPDLSLNPFDHVASVDAVDRAQLVDILRVGRKTNAAIATQTSLAPFYRRFERVLRG